MQRCVFGMFVLCFCFACSRNDTAPSGQNRNSFGDRSTEEKDSSSIIPSAEKRQAAVAIGGPPDTSPGDKRENETADDYLQLEKKLSTGNFRQVKPVSSRSWSVRIVFSQGGSAIFKPLLKGDSSARFEVAYYRLARLLGVEKVPVSVMRPIYPSRLENALEKEGPEIATEFMAAIERDKKGRVWGAMIQWLDGVERLGVEKANGKIDVAALFSQEKYARLVHGLSDMVVLDYVTSNWDRFSGGNLFLLNGKTQLALIDHNEAFYNLSPKQYEKLENYLGHISCVDSILVENLRGITKEKLSSAVDVTPWEGELLRSEELDNVLKRTEKFLGKTNMGIESKSRSVAPCGKNGIEVVTSTRANRLNDE